MRGRILSKKNGIGIIIFCLLTSMLACTSTPSDDDEFKEHEPPAQEGEAKNAATSSTESDSVADAAGFEEDAATQAASSGNSKDLEQSVADANSSTNSSTEVPAPTPEPMPDTANSISKDPGVDDLSLNSASPIPTPESSLDSEPSGTVSEPVSVPNQTATITNIQFKSNENGGTVVIDASSPITYTTRSNPDQNQFIVEIPNSILPSKLKRPYNTRDFAGNIGAIDAYQSAGSKTTKVVIQLRANASTPTVQQEGNAILVVANNVSNGISDAAVTDSMGRDSISGAALRANSGAAESTTQEGGADDGILPGRNLEEFLSGNQKYYGTPIFIETDDMDLRTALRFIADESGANLVISDEIKGNVSLKLRNVPWDQALVVIMKAKKLGYTRQGDILRISPLADIRLEEEDAQKAAASRRTLAPLKVRMIPVSFAKMEDLTKQVQPFLTKDRGQVVGDARTNALIVTDTEEVLEKVDKIVKNLDIPPAQVLIEGKIVEARETFNRSLGVDWSIGGRSIKLADGSAGPITMTPSLSFTNGATSGSPLGFGLQVGTLDILGDLNALLTLGEKEDKVKVISSPRILALHNEAAEIIQGSEQPFISVTTTNGTTTKSVNFKPIRLRLNVVPQITADNSVIMALDVLREFPGAVADTETGAAPVNQRSAKTKVLVQNGQTAVIGGIYQADESNAESGVPYLKDIPVLGYLFGEKKKTKDKTELLIFLTPRVLATTKGSQTNSVDMGGTTE